MRAAKETFNEWDGRRSASSSAGDEMTSPSRESGTFLQKKGKRLLNVFPSLKASYATRNSGKPAVASATLNPGISKHFWMLVFTGMTEGRTTS
jgi:hypothetical protein